MRIWEQVSTRTSPVNLAVPHFNLAQVYLAQGKLSAAEPEARSTQELDSPDNRPRIGLLIAHIQFRSGNYVEAEQGLRAALHGLEGAEQATALNSLGMVRAALGDLPQARRLMESSLVTREQAGVLSGPDDGRMLADLALVCFRQGDLTAAAVVFASHSHARGFPEPG